MPNITAPGLTFPSKSFPGAPTGTPSGVAGELMLSEVLGRYSTLVKSGKVQIAYAVLAASSPVIFSTNTLTGGPILWNKPNSSVDAHLLAMSVSVSVAASTGTAGAIGITGGSGQTAVMTATTAIDNIGNALAGGPSSAMVVFRTATPGVAGTLFVPVFNIGTTAITAMFAPTWVDLAGSIIVPAATWAGVAGSSTQTNLVASVALMWAELPA